MPIADDARAYVLVADYIGVDAVTKLNIIGGSFGFTAVQANGLTPPQCVAAQIEVPAKYLGDSVNLALELVDLERKSAVMLPGPSGKLEALRVQQDAIVVAPAPQPPVVLPRDFSPRLNVVLSFANGLPLPSGHFCEWRLKINGYHRKGWSAQFYVLPIAQAPVFGGPGGSSDIPNVQNPETLEDDLEPPEA